jgi:hypothetical protein
MQAIEGIAEALREEEESFEPDIDQSTCQKKEGVAVKTWQRKGVAARRWHTKRDWHVNMWEVVGDIVIWWEGWAIESDKRLRQWYCWSEVEHTVCQQ